MEGSIPTYDLLLFILTRLCLLHIATLYLKAGSRRGGPVRLEWPRRLLERGDGLRERLTFGILILLLIFLFAFTFAVLGKGEYEPGAQREASPALALSLPA